MSSTDNPNNTYKVTKEKLTVYLIAQKYQELEERTKRQPQTNQELITKEYNKIKEVIDYNKSQNHKGLNIKDHLQTSDLSNDQPQPPTS